MSQRIWNEKKFGRFIKEGRGKGKGKDYIPWIKTREVPSSGRRARTPGWKTGRLHHVLSDHETRYFYLLEWADNVVDIREQFPLIDIKTAENIATDMGVKYPTDLTSGFPYVLTTDFLITVNINGKFKHLARTIKPSNELSRKRVIEKFEIERRYWIAKGIDWGIVTENEIPKTLANNVGNIHSDYYLESIQNLTVDHLYGIADLIKETLKISNRSILDTIKNLDEDLSIDTGTCLKIFRHLVARKEIIINMSVKMDFTKSAQSIIFINFNKRLKEEVA